MYFSGLVTISNLTIEKSIPYILSALGGTFSERSGVVNIALEGILLTGAFTTVLFEFYTGNPYLGLLGGILGGVLIAGLHALISVKLKADQIISGIALNLLALGLTRFLLMVFFGSSSNSSRIAGISAWQIPGLVNVPILNNLFCHPLIFLTILSVIIVHIVLFHTPFGLRLRAVGEMPSAADTLGINVEFMRYAGVLLSGVFAGLGGAYLACYQHSFTDGMSAGRGFIALAAMILGKWTPSGIVVACLLFAFADALQSYLQMIQWINIPSQFIQMIPYALTIIVLAGVIGKVTPPAALGKPYRRE